MKEDTYSSAKNQSVLFAIFHNMVDLTMNFDLNLMIFKGQIYIFYLNREDCKMFIKIMHCTKL